MAQAWRSTYCRIQTHRSGKYRGSLCLLQPPRTLEEGSLYSLDQICQRKCGHSLDDDRRAQSKTGIVTAAGGKFSHFPAAEIVGMLRLVYGCCGLEGHPELERSTICESAVHSPGPVLCRFAVRSEGVIVFRT